MYTFGSSSLSFLEKARMLVELRCIVNYVFYFDEKLLKVFKAEVNLALSNILC